MKENVIISLADSNYFELLDELVDSIKRFKESDNTAICILDAGLSEEQKNIKNDLDSLLSSLPNIPLDDVPIGSDEKDNIEIEKKGVIKNFNFKPKSHYELGENLKMLDFDLASKTTGSRFTFVNGELVFNRRFN